MGLELDADPGRESRRLHLLVPLHPRSNDRRITSNTSDQRASIWASSKRASARSSACYSRPRSTAEAWRPLTRFGPATPILAWAALARAPMMCAVCSCRGPSGSSGGGGTRGTGGKRTRSPSVASRIAFVVLRAAIGPSSVGRRGRHGPPARWPAFVPGYAPDPAAASSSSRDSHSARSASIFGPSDFSSSSSLATSSFGVFS